MAFDFKYGLERGCLDEFHIDDFDMSLNIDSPLFFRRQFVSNHNTGESLLPVAWCLCKSLLCLFLYSN